MHSVSKFDIFRDKTSSPAICILTLFRHLFDNFFESLVQQLVISFSFLCVDIYSVLLDEHFLVNKLMLILLFPPLKAKNRQLKTQVLTNGSEKFLMRGLLSTSKENVIRH